MKKLSRDGSIDSKNSGRQSVSSDKNSQGGSTAGSRRGSNRMAPMYTPGMSGSDEPDLHMREESLERVRSNRELVQKEEQEAEIQRKKMSERTPRDSEEAMVPQSNAHISFGMQTPQNRSPENSEPPPLLRMAPSDDNVIVDRRITRGVPSTDNFKKQGSGSIRMPFGRKSEDEVVSSRQFTSESSNMDSSSAPSGEPSSVGTHEISEGSRRKHSPQSRFGGHHRDEEIFLGMTGKQIAGTAAVIVVASILIEQVGELTVAVFLFIGLAYFHMQSKKNKQHVIKDSYSSTGRPSGKTPANTNRNLATPRRNSRDRTQSPGGARERSESRGRRPSKDATPGRPSPFGQSPRNNNFAGRQLKSPSSGRNRSMTPEQSGEYTPPQLSSRNMSREGGMTPSWGDGTPASRSNTGGETSRSATRDGSTRARKVGQGSSAYQARVNASIAGKNFKAPEDTDTDGDSSPVQRHREKTLGDCLPDYFDREDPFGNAKFEKKHIELSDVDKADRLINALSGDNLNRYCVLVSSEADLTKTKADGNPVQNSGYRGSHVWSCSPGSLRSHIGAGTAFNFTPRNGGSAYGSSAYQSSAYSSTPSGRGFSPMVGASPRQQYAPDATTPTMNSEEHEQPVESETTDELTVVDSSYLNAGLSAVQNMSELDKFILQHVDEMDAVSYALAFSRGVRFDDSLNVLSRPGMRALLNKIESSLHDKNLVCICGAMCNILWNMTKIRTRHHDKGTPNSQQILATATLMVDVATVNLWVFTQRELTNFMWSLSSLAQSHNSNVRLPFEQDKNMLFRGLPPKFRQSVTRLFLTFSTLYQDQAHTFKGQEISNLAVAFCRSAHGVNHEVSPTFRAMREMTTAMADQCGKRVGELQAQHVANTTWAFVKLGLSNPAILGKYLEEVCRTLTIDNAVFFMKPQEVANIIWALARAKGKMGVTVDNVNTTFPIVDKALIEVSFNHFVPQDYANLVWSHACLDIPDREFFLAVFAQAKRIFHSFRSQELSNFLWGFSKTGVAPDVHAELYGMVKDILLTVPLEKHSNQSLVNICYSGIRMDQFEPEVYGNVAERLATQMSEKNSRAKNILTTQEMSNMAWVLAKLPEHLIVHRVKEQTSFFIRQVSRICVMTIRNFTVQELANILWSVAKTHEQEGNIIFNEAYGIIVSKKGSLRMEERAQIEWAYSTVGMDPLNDDGRGPSHQVQTNVQQSHQWTQNQYGNQQPYPPAPPLGGKGGQWQGSGYGGNRGQSPGNRPPRAPKGGGRNNAYYGHQNSGLQGYDSGVLRGRSASPGGRFSSPNNAGNRGMSQSPEPPQQSLTSLASPQMAGGRPGGSLGASPKQTTGHQFQ